MILVSKSKTGLIDLEPFVNNLFPTYLPSNGFIDCRGPYLNFYDWASCPPDGSVEEAWAQWKF